MSEATAEFQPTISQQVEVKFGKNAIEGAAGTTRQIFEMIKIEMAQIGDGEGSSRQQEKKVAEYLEMWREFSNGLFARVASENARSPKTVETAIRGASALFSVDPTKEGEIAASKMIKSLQQRYGL